MLDEHNEQAMPSENCKLNSLVRQYRHGLGCLIRSIPLTVLRNAARPAAQRTGTATQREIAAAIRAELDRQFENTVCHQSLLSRTFLEWAWATGEARKDPNISIGFHLDFENSNAVWRSVSMCSWGTFRCNYMPASGNPAADIEYDDAVSFVRGNMNTAVARKLQEYAEDGALAEVDVLCSAGGTNQAHVTGEPRRGFGKLMLLHALGQIAARSRRGAAKYEGVIVSVSYNDQYPFQTSKMRALLTNLGFQEVNVYREGTAQPARDAAQKRKHYMAIHNAAGGQKWWTVLSTKLAALPAVCPPTSGLGVGMCN
jgi:hypothetical protein